MNPIDPGPPDAEDPSVKVQSISDYAQYLNSLHTNLKVQAQSTSSMSKPTLRELLDRNRTYSLSHEPLPTLEEYMSSKAPTPKVLIVTCADPRCEPYQFMGIHPFDALALRTIGGRVEPQIPGLLAVDTIFNFNEIAIIHHTDCGATHYTTDDIRRILRERAPGKEREIDALKFNDFKDIAGSVREDLKIFRDSPFPSKVLKENAHGYVFDIKTGELTNVEA